MLQKMFLEWTVTVNSASSFHCSLYLLLPFSSLWLLVFCRAHLYHCTFVLYTQFFMQKSEGPALFSNSESFEF